MTLDGDGHLVEGSLHLREGDDKLLVAANGHFIVVFVLPGDDERLAAQLREYGNQLLLEIIQGGGDFSVDDKTADLGLIVAFGRLPQVEFEGNTVFTTHVDWVMMPERSHPGICTRADGSGALRKICCNHSKSELAIDASIWDPG